MGLKVGNRYYSNKEITPVLIRRGFIVTKMKDTKGLRCLVGTQNPSDEIKILDTYEVFKSIINKRMHQTKQQFLDSL